MRHRRLLAIAALLAGCGAAPAASAATMASAPRAAHGGEAEVRIRELESHLEARRAEVRELRGELERARTVPREVVRIGEERARVEPEPIAVEDDVPRDDVPRDDGPRDEGPRPMLRLYGSPRPAASAGASAEVTPLPGPRAPEVVPPPPPIAELGRLPVMASSDVPAIPDRPITVEPSATPPPAVAPGLSHADEAPADDAAAREYRRALADVEARRWSEALAGFEAFVAAHPAHPYADNALYWQGEIFFARREYRRSIETLDALLIRYPQGNKVPDALLRAGLCYERLGEPERARAYFRRVREQFPDSVAARLASREET